MIPTEEQCQQLWDKYQLPEYKRKHVTLVAKVARFLAKNFTTSEKLLVAGALLHDIDKNIAKYPGEQHPDMAVRILKEEGMEEVAKLVATHPLHAILDPNICPRTIEEKLLFLSDKMVKSDIITVEERFTLWNNEHLPQDAQKILDESYPKVKDLETEIFSMTTVKPEDVKKLA